MFRWGCYGKKYLVGRKCPGYPDRAEVETTMKSGERAKDGLVGANVGNGGERIIRRLLGGPKHLRLERLRQGRERQLYWWQVKELIP